MTDLVPANSPRQWYDITGKPLSAEQAAGRIIIAPPADPGRPVFDTGSICPRCGAEEEDLDGFGFLYCSTCRLCLHPDRYGGVCGICGDKKEDPQ